MLTSPSSSPSYAVAPSLSPSRPQVESSCASLEVLVRGLSEVSSSRGLALLLAHLLQAVRAVNRGACVTSFTMSALNQTTAGRLH